MTTSSDTMIGVNWSQLPAELLIHIVENHLLSVDDVIIFSSVCHSWNHAARACDKSQLRENGRRQLPWLMLTDGNDNEVYSDTENYDKYFKENNSDSDTSSDEDEHHPQEVQNDKNDDLLVNYYSNIDDGKRKLLNLSHNRNKCYNLSLPELYGKACWGSSYGWIVVLGPKRRMHLFNPITRAQLPLPFQTTFRYPWKRAGDKIIRALFMSKVIVLRVPQDGRNDVVSWLVVAIHSEGSQVALARPGDASWAHVSWHDGLDDIVMDATYWTKSKWLVFVGQEGDLFYYDIHNSKQPQELRKYVIGPEGLRDQLIDDEQLQTLIITYIGQLGNDDLLIIARRKRFKHGNNGYFDNGHCYKTENFKVYRHNFTTRNWEELSDLGNVALFVGENETICIDALDAGCGSNCIYFCDEESYCFHVNRDKVGGDDMGVYNLRHKTIESFYDGNSWKSSYCAPFWFSPAM